MAYPPPFTACFMRRRSIVRTVARAFAALERRAPDLVPVIVLGRARRFVVVDLADFPVIRDAVAAPHESVYPAAHWPRTSQRAAPAVRRSACLCRSKPT